MLLNFYFLHTEEKAYDTPWIQKFKYFTGNWKEWQFFMNNEFLHKRKKNDLALEKCVCMCRIEVFIGYCCKSLSIFVYVLEEWCYFAVFFFHTLCVLYLLFLRITVYVFLMRKKIKKEKAKKKVKENVFLLCK